MHQTDYLQQMGLTVWRQRPVLGRLILIGRTQPPKQILDDIRRYYTAPVLFYHDQVVKPEMLQVTDRITLLACSKPTWLEQPADIEEQTLTDPLVKKRLWQRLRADV